MTLRAKGVSDRTPATLPAGGARSFGSSTHARETDRAFKGGRSVSTAAELRLPLSSYSLASSACTCIARTAANLGAYVGPSTCRRGRALSTNSTMARSSNDRSGARVGVGRCHTLCCPRRGESSTSVYQWASSGRTSASAPRYVVGGIASSGMTATPVRAAAKARSASVFGLDAQRSQIAEHVRIPWSPTVTSICVHFGWSAAGLRLSDQLKPVVSGWREVGQDRTRLVADA